MSGGLERLGPKDCMSELRMYVLVAGVYMLSECLNRHLVNSMIKIRAYIDERDERI